MYLLFETLWKLQDFMVFLGIIIIGFSLLWFVNIMEKDPVTKKMVNYTIKDFGNVVGKIY